MISMEMRNKDVIDLIIRYMKTPELMLGSFGTIDKKIPPKYMKYLSGRVSIGSRNG
jgi:hypothetical protein